MLLSNKTKSLYKQRLCVLLLGALLVLPLLLVLDAKAQELYPYSEPASNMPSRSVSAKFTSMFGKGVHGSRVMQRHMPEVMFGLNKKWMVHVNTTFSDMYGQRLKWESVRTYAKWRFFSVDDVHKHFRIAAFGAATYSRNSLLHNEINLMMGDQSGVQMGLIATQLWNKLALSGTGSLNEVLKNERWQKTSPQPYTFRSFNYSISGGYLLFPRAYKNYDQLNINLYTELLGSRNIDWPKEKYYIDLAPSVQFIFKSTGKLNIGYRFQLSGDIYRLTRKTFMISYEHLFLDALRKKSKPSGE